MPHPPPRSDAPLTPYRKKRAPGVTGEPLGRADAARPGLFVVQKHAARSLHYDLRIEVGGVLKSWAVPKGPSLDPKDKRLAVATEDHPVEYGEFEGLIPAGQYGAGGMILWDRGLCVPHIDHQEGLEAGKLLFELHGYKLRGLFTLVQTKREPRQWLLIKKPDAFATGDTVDTLPPESVYSGLTVEELRDGHDRAAAIREELVALQAPRRALRAAKVKLMLAELQREPFSDPNWIFEIKYDGFRLIAGKGEAAGPLPEEGPGQAGVRLLTRNGLDATHRFPDIVRALATLPFRSLVLDGEVTVLDEEARPSFQRLQKRAQLVRPRDIERTAIVLPAVYFVFDLLGFEDFDLRPLPLATRKALLQRVLPRAGPLRFADHITERGEAMFEAVRARGLEGLIAKKADAPYRAGRSAAWRKLRAERSDDFVVVGYKRPPGTDGFRALHLGVLEGARLVYAGSVGTGFSRPQEKEISGQLAALQRAEPSFSGEAPRGAEHRWVEPRLVVEVRFLEYTESGHLRHPVFLRLRGDKRPEDCLRADLLPPPTAASEAPEPPKPRPALRFTRPGKVFWPAEGYTKGDLISYYRAVSPWLLPYLASRPVVLDRYPDGIEGKSFFQKNVPDFAPDWIRTEPIWSEDAGREVFYFIADDVETLLYMINLGAIPLHVGASRMETLQAPDWCILDLDAKQAPFVHVVAVARHLHALCESIGLDCFAKTSGATGMHVLLPLGGCCTHAQARQLGEVLAKVAAQELTEIASTVRTAAARRGRVYIDALQNGFGKLLVAPFSVRPLPRAPVSTPLRWEEVNDDLDPRAFTIQTMPARCEALEEDPLRPIFERRPALTEILARLAERL